ncbi:hypothetical protein V8F06_003752 [Rhypophila decipiens]
MEWLLGTRSIMGCHLYPVPVPVSVHVTCPTVSSVQNRIPCQSLTRTSGLREKDSATIQGRSATGISHLFGAPSSGTRVDINLLSRCRGRDGKECCPIWIFFLDSIWSSTTTLKLNNSLDKQSTITSNNFECQPCPRSAQHIWAKHIRLARLGPVRPRNGYHDSVPGLRPLIRHHVGFLSIPYKNEHHRYQYYHGIRNRCQSSCPGHKLRAATCACRPYQLMDRPKTRIWQQLGASSWMMDVSWPPATEKPYLAPGSSKGRNPNCRFWSSFGRKWVPQPESHDPGTIAAPTPNE